MKVNLDLVLSRLFSASGIDPGNPLLGAEVEKYARRARVAVMEDGSLEITDKRDARGKKEGLLALLNPYTYGLQSVDNLNAALSNKRIREEVKADLEKAGVELLEE